LLTEQEQSTVHDSCMGNRRALEAVATCGCFFCLQVFPSSEIEKWVDRATEARGMTALCPYCEIDSVIPSTASARFGTGLLSAMKEYWFPAPGMT
jgi:hypothetical protein